MNAANRPYPGLGGARPNLPPGLAGIVTKSRDQDGQLQIEVDAGYWAAASFHEKAKITIQSLTDGDGFAEPEFRREFLVLVQKKPVVLRAVRRVDMTNFDSKMNRLDFDQRVLYPVGASGQLTNSMVSGPSFLSTNLRATTWRGQIPIKRDLADDSVVGSLDAMRQYVMTGATERIGEDIEETVILGDTASANPVLSEFDGYLKLAQTNTVPSIGAQLTTPDIAQMRITMPDRFAEGDDMRIWLGRRTAVQYSAYLSGRATGMGDAYVDTIHNASRNGGLPEELFRSAQVWDYTQGVGDQTSVLLASMSNLLWGVYKDLEIAVDIDLHGDQVVMYPKIRYTAEILEKRATVQLTGLTAP